MEIAVDYTNCYSAVNDFVDLAPNQYSLHFPNSGSVKSSVPRYRARNLTVTDSITGKSLDTVRCTIHFPVPVDMKPPVFLYYRLDGFYQNHRKYVKSFDGEQLKGKAKTRQELTAGNCADFVGPTNTADVIYYPCGYIPNSLFNDTLHNITQLTGANSTNSTNPPSENNSTKEYIFSEKNIAWTSDLTRITPTQYVDFNQVLPPPNWQNRFVDGKYDAKTIKAIAKDEHLLVWMRTAGLPNFRKLWGKNTTTTIPAGVYSIDVDMCKKFSPINDNYEG